VEEFAQLNEESVIFSIIAFWNCNTFLKY